MLALLVVQFNNWSTYESRTYYATHQAGKPVVFLAEWFGVPDDAGGYVYFDGTARPGLEFDLFGCLATLAHGASLGNGWWYVSC